MKNRYLLRSLRFVPALLGLATLCTSALATPTIYNNVQAYSILDYDQSFRNTTNSSGGIEADGSTFRRKGCTGTASGSNAPGGDCFIFDPNLVPAPTTWYQRPNVYTYAAAQALTNYGVNKARAWSIGQTTPFDPQDSTSIAYVGEAVSQYVEEISYFGAVPMPVTVRLHLSAAWNDSGRFTLAIGSGIEYDPDADHPYTVGGALYTNCPPLGGCPGINNVVVPANPSDLFYVAGNDPANVNGSVDQYIDFTLLLKNGINPFLVQLHAFAYDAGAQMDAFSTVTLDSITVQPGVSLTFGSGTNYNVLIAGDPTVPPNGVPEPGAPLLLLTGLAAMWGSRRMKK
jgi:hypothetical protein